MIKASVVPVWLLLMMLAAEVLAAGSRPHGLLLADTEEERGPNVPGRISVNEEQAERALDRSLVQTGALLLSPGMIELEPGVDYMRREESTVAFIERDGRQIPVERERETDEFTMTMALRWGLPWDAQLELELPYHWKRRESSSEVEFTAIDRVTASGSGVGNLRLGFAKTMAREQDWKPDVIGRVTWDTRTGEAGDGGLDIASDFDRVQLSLSAIKRQDPLIFIGGVAYEEVFERNDINPGAAVAPSIGVFVGLSPATSMRFSLFQTFRQKTEISGRSVVDSDRHAATFTIGASSLLAKGVLVDVSCGVGLTDDAEDYSIHVSLPVRLSRLVF